MDGDVKTFRAAQYVRMSTEHQQYSTSNQGDNVRGLERDARCVEIAAFALALTAWRYPDEKGNPIGYAPQ